MENLAHSLMGATLARAGLGRRVPLGAPALVIAANLPDLDSVVRPLGSLYYFYYHRGITHAVLGIVIIGLLYALLLWLLNRRRKQPERVSFRMMLGAVYIVLGTHPLIDWTNSYGWRPYLPFSDEWIYGDLVFIVDPYIWLILGGGVLLAAKRGRRGQIAWLSGVLLLSTLVLLHAMNDPQAWWLPVIWFSSLLLLSGLKRYRPVWGPSVILYSLLGLGFYWLLLAGLHYSALSSSFPQISTLYPQVKEEQVSALPRLAHPFEWEIFFEDNEAVYYGRAKSFGGISLGPFLYPRNLRHPAVQAALNSCPGALMAYFARFEYFEVSEGEEGPTVILRDARFNRGGHGGIGYLEIPLTWDLRLRHQIPCP